MIRVDEKHPLTLVLRRTEATLQDLQGKLVEKERALEDATAKYTAWQKRFREDGIAAEAENLLSGNAVPCIQTIEQLEHEIRVLNVAIEKQAKVVNSARGDLSVVICELNRDRYIEIEKRIFRAICDLAQANQAEQEFFEALRDAGCSSISFQIMRLNQIGLPSDPLGQVSLHRREFEKFCPEVLVDSPGTAAISPR